MAVTGAAAFPARFTGRPSTSVSTHRHTSSFAAWIVEVAKQATPPLVQSISYGGYETETRSSNVAPEVESLLMHGIGKLLSGN